ncbi:hypothetical protein PRBEI_2000738300 [Prionailurus iriomotensis]
MRFSPIKMEASHSVQHHKIFGNPRKQYAIINSVEPRKLESVRCGRMRGRYVIVNTPATRKETEPWWITDLGTPWAVAIVSSTN